MNKWYRSIITLTLFCFSTHLLAQAPVPVRDKKHQKWSKVMQDVQMASQVINTRVTAFVRNIKDVQEFTAKAVTLVNGVIKNLRMVNEIIRIQNEIAELVSTSIGIISSPKDVDGDGVDDFELLDKWKHIQVLLAIASQAENVFDLFKHTVEDDSTIMDDKGRLTIIKEVYIDARRIKQQIKAQLRRINKEVYQFKRLKKEGEIFDELFGITS